MIHDREDTKKEILTYMKELGIHEKYIKGFKNKGIINVFLTSLNSAHDVKSNIKLLYKEIARFEKDYGAVVCAVVCKEQRNANATLYHFVYLPNNDDTWANRIYKKQNNKHFIQTYCWNREIPMFSDFSELKIEIRKSDL